MEKHLSIAGISHYDAARMSWGGTWRLPTLAEFQELVDRCIWTWNTSDGHNGYLIVGPNGNSIFLPSAGYRYDTSIYQTEEFGYYWTSTPDPKRTQNAYYLQFSNSDHYVIFYVRCNGQSIRSVLE